VKAPPCVLTKDIYPCKHILPPHIVALTGYSFHLSESPRQHLPRQWRTRCNKHNVNCLSVCATLPFHQQRLQLHNQSDDADCWINSSFNRVAFNCLNHTTNIPTLASASAPWQVPLLVEPANLGDCTDHYGHQDIAQITAGVGHVLY
jgi:hypothetical protein